MPTVFIDTETRSALHLPLVGAARYAESFELLLVTWAVGEDAPRYWAPLLTPEPPTDLADALRDAREIWAHNAAFDRLILASALPELCPALDKWRCTMACAYAHSLPGSLDALGAVLALPPELRKREGKQLRDMFCQVAGPAPSERPIEWAAFVEYGLTDVRALREVHRRLPKVNYTGAELALWHEDQRINARGIYIDAALAKGAIAACTEAQDAINRRIDTLTSGRVTSATQSARLAKELGMSNLQKASVAAELDTSDGWKRELLELRQQGARSSVAKYQRMLSMRCRDGRLRGAFQFCGAGRTGRWAGRGVQLQNLPRQTHPPEMLDALADAAAHGLLPVVGNVIDECVELLRSTLRASPGKRLVVADWSNIESRMLAWLAGETRKLDAYRAFDAGSGPDLYRKQYVDLFGGSLDAANRAVGKAIDLGCQYCGGAGSIAAHAKNFQIDFSRLAPIVLRAATSEQLRSAEWLYDNPPDGLARPDERDDFIVRDLAKQLWRQQHPMTVRYWAAISEAFHTTFASGTAHAVGPLRFTRAGKHMCIRLPSGRQLIFPNVRQLDDGALGFNKVPSWAVERVWSGLLTENIVQACARDVLRAALLRLRGVLPVVMHVHDEIVVEVAESAAPESLETLISIMQSPLPWADGLPLRAAGYTAVRYRKE